MDRVIKKNNWSFQKIALYVGVPLLVLLLGYLMYQTTGASRLKVKKDRLSVSTVTYGSFQEFIVINGVVEPIKTVYLDPGQGGKVEELYLEGGEMVKKGDIIVKLSNPSLELNYMNLETNLLEQADQLRNTKITLETSGLALKDQLAMIEFALRDFEQQYKRSMQLFEDSVIAEQEFLTLKNSYLLNIERKKLMLERIAKDSVLRERQLVSVEKSLALVDRNLDAIQRNLDQLTIKAPISGQLSSLTVEIGESISSGQNLGQIDVLDGFKVRARIDEHYISRITPGLKGNFPFSGEKYDLVIRKVFPEVTNGTFEVDMEFVDTVPQGIKRGQTLQIRLALSDETQALLLPRGGFYQSTGGNWVYVVDPEAGVAYKRDIKIGRQSDRHYEVTSGLEEGEKVVTSNYETFNNVDELVLTE